MKKTILVLIFYVSYSLANVLQNAIDSAEAYDILELPKGIYKGNILITKPLTIISLDKEDFIVNFDSKENFAVAKRDGFIVFISTSRNKEMMAKGLVKDIARRLQTLRKERGYNPTDVLEVASILELDEESLEMIKEKNEELAFLVRVKKVNFEKSCKEYKDDDIDGQKIKISVE